MFACRVPATFAQRNTRCFRSFAPQPSQISPANPTPTSPAVAAANAVIRPSPTRSRGSFRGGITGFLLGIAAAGASGYYLLVDEYSRNGHILLSSVEELQRNVGNVKEYAQKIEELEKAQQNLRSQSATKEELAQLRNEILKIQDNAAIEHLELKTQVWGIEQELMPLKEGKEITKEEK